MEMKVEKEDYSAITRIGCVPTGLHDPSAMQRIELPVDGAFLLKGFLSDAECQYFIAESEKIGYTPPGELFDVRYRTNDRIVAISVATAELLFERVKPFVPETITVRDSVWEICGLNESWRFCRYAPGGFFSQHVDGEFVRNSNERSLITLNIYLNGDFDGGTTNFLAKTYHDVADREITAQVVPQAGLALVFPHDRLHEGASLGSGVKYLLRSDIMYRRRGVPACARAAGEPDDKYIEAVNLYQRASALERKGEAHEAMLLYRRAFKMCPQLETDQLV
eukprot:TRINITY_DN1140_c0_g1_i7.p1 TRINITY_DN1140_c0_g1~~TRINITY_DN1140_c0_g1_i7.p1  ORF type:complete len:288 (+),score=28.12 TRINITY_DN1140_c0_g1_i7:28-864(+)